MKNRTHLDLKRVLCDRWDCRVSALHLVGEGCYRAASDRGPLFVKVTDGREEFLNDLHQGLEVQCYVGRVGIPTNPPLRTTDGNLSVRVEGCGVQAHPWIEHQRFERNLARWREFGGIVGRLHAIEVEDGFKPSLARMEPRRTLETVRRRITSHGDRIPEGFRTQFHGLCKVADQLGDLSAAGRCLIHTDLAWGNVLRPREGCLLLVDFEGAGIGPAIVDLVEVTTYLCGGPGGSLKIDAARAFYEGYGEHRRLTDGDIALFHQAHCYHQIYYLADSLGRGDYDFIRRALARLDNWAGGVLNRLAEIATA